MRASPTVTIEEVFTAIDRSCKEAAMFNIEHHLDLVLLLANNACVLDPGFVSHEGQAQAALTDRGFRKQALWL